MSGDLEDADDAEGELKESEHDVEEIVVLESMLQLEKGTPVGFLQDAWKIEVVNSRDKLLMSFWPRL
jgi:hypothetical protein